MSKLSQSTCIAVLGAGTMGAGIAQVAAAAGHQVLLYDINAKAIDLGINLLSKGLEKQVSRGKMSAAESAALIGRIQPCTDLTELANTGLIIEAIVEKLEVKQNVFCELEGICGEGVIFASNTSSISITSIGAALKCPERLLGMHFFNPAPILKLVEIVSGVATDPNIAQTIYDTAQSWGKTPVFVRSTPGFIVNRVARPFYAEALRVLEEGAADVSTIDRIMRESGGFRMGPFELMDLIGHDVNYAVTSSVYDAFYQDPRFKPSLAQLELVEAGFLGRKTGRGFYNYNVKETFPSIEEPVCFSPKKISVYGDLGNCSSLIDLALKADIDVERYPNEASNFIKVEGTNIFLTDGRSATEKAAATGHDDVVTFDLSFDYLTSNRITLAKADQASNSAIENACGFFQSLGKQVTVIDDIPGMIVMRTLCMIINEAAETVHHSVATMKDVDLAMCKGVNYPKGPFAWGDEIGLKNIHDVLRNLQNSYGEDRYRPSLFLRRRVYAGRSFYN